MALSRSDEVTVRATVGEIDQLIVLAESGLRALIGKIVHQLNDQAASQEMPRPRPVAAE